MPGILGVFANSIIPPRPIKSSITPDNELFWYFDLEQKKRKKETRFLNNSSLSEFLIESNGGKI